MFHCNGWTYTWAVTAVGGTHVCLRKVDPAVIFPLIEQAGVTHLCGAPIVLNMLVHAPAEAKRRFGRTIEVATGGAAPPSAVIEAMERMGFHVTHLYGLTESYGPATVCVEQAGLAGLPMAERARLMARQGVRYPTLGEAMVADPATMAPVPADGTTLGEIMLRGNTVMKGYLKNPTATAEAFRGDWYHTGDLAVLPSRRLRRGQGPRQGHHHLRRREHLLARGRGGALPPPGGDGGGRRRHARRAVRRAPLRVRHPEARWRRRTKPASSPGAASSWPTTRRRARVVFGPLPKTSTGKIQKFELRERAKQV